MRGFSESLLLVAFTLLPSLFVNGQLHQTSSFKPVRRNSVLRGLLISRQGVCDPGFVGCEATGCCPTGWNCCVGSSIHSQLFFFSSFMAEFLFFFFFLPQTVTAVILREFFFKIGFFKSFSESCFFGV